MESASSSTQTPRIHGLDAYRGVLMLLGIVLHAALPFVKEVDTNAHLSHHLIDVPFWAVRLFRM